MTPIVAATSSPLDIFDAPAIATARENPPMAYQVTGCFQPEPLAGAARAAGACGRMARGPPPNREPDRFSPHALAGTTEPFRPTISRATPCSSA